MTRRYCILALLSILITVSVSFAAKPVRVLVITGQHGYNKPEFNKMFTEFKGMDCTFKETGGNPGELFNDISDFPYDVIALYNFKQSMNDAQKKNFLKLFDQGVGLVSMHHAIAGFPDWEEYENLIGATYVLKEQTRSGKHFPRPKWKHGVDMQIKVEDKEHPITKGIQDFKINDESYKGWIYHGTGHLLLSTDNELNNKQIAWTVPHPKTRVFYIQLGHDEHAFQNDNYRKLVQQGIQWTASKK